MERITGFLASAVRGAQRCLLTQRSAKRRRAPGVWRTWSAWRCVRESQSLGPDARPGARLRAFFRRGRIRSVRFTGRDAGAELEEPAEVVGVAPGFCDQPAADAEDERRGEHLWLALGRDAEELLLGAGVGGADGDLVAFGDHVVDRPLLL